jgi:hypothetical protein
MSLLFLLFEISGKLQSLDEESENLWKWMEMGEWHAPTLTRPRKPTPDHSIKFVQDANGVAAQTESN